MDFKLKFILILIIAFNTFNVVLSNNSNIENNNTLKQEISFNKSEQKNSDRLSNSETNLDKFYGGGKTKDIFKRNVMYYNNETVLMSGIPSIGQLNLTGDNNIYSIDVPINTTSINIILEVPDEVPDVDFDLFARGDIQPTINDYDYVSEKSDSYDENIIITNLSMSTLFIMTYSFEGSGNYTLLAVLYSNNNVTLLNNEEISYGYLNFSADFDIYSFYILPNTVSVNILLDVPIGKDFDLYARFDYPPSTSNYFDRSARSTDVNENIIVANPTNGTWYLIIRSFNGNGSYSLRISIDSQEVVKSLMIDVTTHGSLNYTGDFAIYSVELPMYITALNMTLNVPENANFDLYVNYDDIATPRNYEERSNTHNTLETILIIDPSQGIWYLMVQSYLGVGNYSLTMTYKGLTINSLLNGIPANGSLFFDDDYNLFTIEIPLNIKFLNITLLVPEDADFDLYTKLNQSPTTNDYDFDSYNGLGLNENIEIFNPQFGIWYIMINAYSGIGNYIITVEYIEQIMTSLTSGIPITGLLHFDGDYDIYLIELPVNTSNLNILLEVPNNADFDLYAKFGSQPTTSDFDVESYTSGDEEIDIDDPQQGIWYLMAYSYSGSGQYTIEAMFTDTEDITSSETTEVIDDFNFDFIIFLIIILFVGFFAFWGISKIIKDVISQNKQLPVYRKSAKEIINEREFLDDSYLKKTCSNCGEKLMTSDEFCYICGNEI
ncbi:MAG: zinc ribbon domain-containing protein [Candidatus Hodarchaeales archaeon]|jgi:hypothetical protein